jgi:hypothetical protein
MSLITITDIESEKSFFSDSENFLNDLGDSELENTVGGVTPTAFGLGAYLVTTAVIAGTGAGLGYIAYRLTHHK